MIQLAIHWLFLECIWCCAIESINVHPIRAHLSKLVIYLAESAHHWVELGAVNAAIQNE